MITVCSSIKESHHHRVVVLVVDDSLFVHMLASRATTTNKEEEAEAQTNNHLPSLIDDLSFFLPSGFYCVAKYTSVKRRTSTNVTNNSLDLLLSGVLFFNSSLLLCSDDG